MRILLVADTYPPEIGSGSKLMRELAETLVMRGHHITVLTVEPCYKLDADDATRSWPEYQVENGIAVVRAPTFALHHVGHIRRGIAILLAPLQMWRSLRRHQQDRFDAAFIYSPPVTLGLIGSLAKREGASFVLNVQDIFPQNAIDLGILRNPLLIAFFRWIERACYRRADIVTAHSRSNLKTLLSANPWLGEKMRILHNWVDVDSSKRPNRMNFRQMFGLERKMVALFAGVIGPSQGVHYLVEAAARVVDLRDLVILIVGNGTEKARVESIAARRGLKNVVFKPFVSLEDYPDLLACSDIGLICLSPDVRTPVVPGKMLGYMAASLPIAAFVNAETDVHEIVAAARCGQSCISSDIHAAEKIIRDLHADRDRRLSMGRSGREYARAHFSREVIVNEIEQLLHVQPRNG